MILEQYDMEKTAIINPSDVHVAVQGCPVVAVACYSRKIVDAIISELDSEFISWRVNANMTFPVYKVSYRGVNIAITMIGVGAPVSAQSLEYLFAIGIKSVVVLGTCGVLDKSIPEGSIILPSAAIRDEGTSYHYLPPSDEIVINYNHLDWIEERLQEMGIEYHVGKVWTTDGFYRETQAKMLKRKEQGCICVDMECAANAAVSQYRQRDVIQIFHAADNLDADKWDVRNLKNGLNEEQSKSITDVILTLAADFANRI